MSRPLRIEFPDALYHVTSRGDRREPIFVDDEDRAGFLAVLATACERLDVAAYAYCLMGNHYHLVITTRRPNLSIFMRQLNGVYTQRFNRRHGKVGHVFQGRFKGILVDRQAYFLEVCRYVELNPVRARMVATPRDWPWSSYRANAELATAPPWLDRGAVHAALLGEEPASSVQSRRAAARYATLVASAPDREQSDSLWQRSLRGQMYLGDDAFLQAMQRIAPQQSLRSSAVPRAQRKRPRSLKDWLAACASREEAIYRAHVDSGLTMTAIADELGLSVGRISQLTRAATPARAGGSAARKK